MPTLTPQPERTFKTVGGKGFTLSDVERRLDQQDAVIGAIRGDTLSQAQALQGVQIALQNVNANLSVIVSSIGEEKEDGNGNYLGTGLLGRTRRVEIAQRSLRELYHRWIAFGSGFFVCGGVAVSAIWWLLSDKLSIVLKGH